LQRLGELYTIARETQIDSTNFDDVSDFVSQLNDRLYDAPREIVAVLEAASRVQKHDYVSDEEIEALALELEGE